MFSEAYTFLLDRRLPQKEGPVCTADNNTITNTELIQSNYPTKVTLQSAAKNSLNRIRTPALRQSKEDKEKFYMVKL